LSFVFVLTAVVRFSFKGINKDKVGLLNYKTMLLSILFNTI
jgi:hypothetical protein